MKFIGEGVISFLTTIDLVTSQPYHCVSILAQQRRKLLCKANFFGIMKDARFKLYEYIVHPSTKAMQYFIPPIFKKDAYAQIRQFEKTKVFTQLADQLQETPLEASDDEEGKGEDPGDESDKLRATSWEQNEEKEEDQNNGVVDDFNNGGSFREDDYELKEFTTIITDMAPKLIPGFNHSESRHTEEKQKEIDAYYDGNRLALVTS